MWLSTDHRAGLRHVEQQLGRGCRHCARGPLRLHRQSDRSQLGSSTALVRSGARYRQHRAHHYIQRRVGRPDRWNSSAPLIISLCDFNQSSVGGIPTGVEQTIVTTPAGTCSGAGGNSPTIVPGGFGWLETDAKKSCSTTTNINTKAYSEPGNTPKQCDLSTIRGKTILIPLFDEADSASSHGNGRGAWYEVYGYAAFHVTGYHFSGQSWNPPCDKNQRCIRGYFTSMVNTDPDFTYGPDAPNLGTSAVYLLPD